MQKKKKRQIDERRNPTSDEEARLPYRNFGVNHTSMANMSLVLTHSGQLLLLWAPWAFAEPQTLVGITRKSKNKHGEGSWEYINIYFKSSSGGMTQSISATLDGMTLIIIYRLGKKSVEVGSLSKQTTAEENGNKKNEIGPVSGNRSQERNHLKVFQSDHKGSLEK